MNKKIIFSIFIVESFIIILGIIKTPVWGDEKNYHIPLVKNISMETIIESNSKYSSAYTPLPYIISKPFYQLISSHFILRVLNTIIFGLTIFMVYKILKGANVREAELYTILISLNPYMLRAGYLFLMTNWGIFFSLTGIYFYFFSNSKHNLLIAHGFWLLAVLSMQWMLMVYVGIIIYEFEQFIIGKKDYRSFIQLLVFKVISLLPMLYLFIIWHGLTHPNFHVHTLATSLPHLNAILAIIGFWFFFFIIKNITKINWNAVKLLIFISPVLLINLPVHSNSHGYNVITGLVSSFCKKVEIVIGIPYSLSTGIFVILGFMGLFQLLEVNSKKNSYFLYITMGLITAFAVSSRLGASHIFVMIPFLILTLANYLNKSRLTFNLLMFQAFLITVIYNIYIIYVRSHGRSFI